MSELERIERHDASLPAKVSGNPEGKGLNGFLLDWHRSEPRSVVAKPPHQILAELFTSMLVLSAAFKYRPAVGVVNYLYWIDDEWTLSLVAPDEWSEKRRKGFVGTCVLQRDMTWTITPSDRITKDEAVSNAIGRFYDAFAEKLDTDLTLEEILPFYVSEFPYYQRLLASGLSRSVRGAVWLGDQRAILCHEWRTLLPKRAAATLLCATAANSD